MTINQLFELLGLLRYYKKFEADDEMIKELDSLMEIIEETIKQRSE